MRAFIAVAAAIAATSASFAVATAANQQPTAQSSAKAPAVDRAMLKQLKALNRNVGAMNRTLGTNPVAGMRYEVVKTNRELDKISESLGLPYLGSRDITDLLYAICKHVNPTGRSSC